MGGGGEANKISGLYLGVFFFERERERERDSPNPHIEMKGGKEKKKGGAGRTGVRGWEKLLVIVIPNWSQQQGVSSF